MAYGIIWMMSLAGRDKTKVGEININRYIASIFLIISLLSGCVKEQVSTQSAPSKKGISSQQVESNQAYKITNAAPIHFQVGAQEFEIVPVFTPIIDYIQKMRETPDADHKELYVSTVVEPFRKEAFGEDGALLLKDKYNFAAPTNIERLNESIQLLEKDYEHFSQLIREVLENSSAVLPGGKTTIYLFPFNPDQYQLISLMNGVTGFATNNKVIVVQIAPQKYKEKILQYVVGHEYHHAVYAEDNKSQESDLFDYVITEGKADAFANLIIPEMDIPWTAELLPDEEQAILKWARERRHSFTKDDKAEMHAGNYDIPKWSDYRLGSQIMQDFLRENPDIPIKEWTFMNPEEILEKSHYAEKLN